MLMSLFLHKVHDDPDPDVYLFPPLKWDPLVNEYRPVPKKSLSYSAAYTEFKNLLKFAGLDPSLYGLHSARIGAATDAFCNNVPDFIIDAKGRWKSSLSKFSYLRVSNNSVAAVGNDYIY
jgi:hypothetical protein